jgi:hypothetical protein
MNIVFAHSRSPSFSEIANALRNETTLERLNRLVKETEAKAYAKRLEAEKASQAQQQSDHEPAPDSTQTIRLGDLTYVWASRPKSQDGGFWMLSPDHYGAIDATVRLTYSVEAMSAELLKLKPWPKDADGGERDPQPGSLADQWRNGPWFVQSTTLERKPETMTEAAALDSVDEWADQADDESDFEAEPVDSYFQLGDVVRLVSGSPKLTVETIDACETCGRIFEMGVVWWDHNLSTLRRDTVTPEAVDLVDDDGV